MAAGLGGGAGEVQAEVGATLPVEAAEVEGEEKGVRRVGV